MPGLELAYFAVSLSSNAVRSRMTTTAPIALITGGNRDLGRSTALELARDGVDVLVSYRTNEQEAEAVVSKLFPPRLHRQHVEASGGMHL